MAKKGRKGLSQKSVDGPVSFNDCRAGLALHAQVLETNLKTLGSEISVPMRISTTRRSLR